MKIFSQWALDGQTRAKINKFQVVKLQEDCFAIEALYSYRVKEKSYMAHYVFKKPYFLNEFSASDNLKFWDMEEMKVWYKSKNPSKSALQKVFPLKEFVYLLVIAALNLYFFFLRRFATQKYQNDS